MPPPPLRDIEWRLVMHCCAHADIARLARCSKDTLRAASSPFAWRHVTIRFDSSRHSHPPATAVTTFARIHYLWRPSSDYTNQIVQADVDALLGTALRIEHLDASWNARIESRLWLQVLRSPLMQRVPRLTFHRGLMSHAPFLSRDVLPLLFGLSRLRTLDVGFLSGCGFGYTKLPACGLASSLTSLTIRDSGSLRYATTLQHFACCPLKYLSISQCGLTGAHLCEFLQSPAFSGLESLRLEECDFSLLEACLVPMLSALHSLHTLHVRRCIGVDVLAESLAHSRSLRNFVHEPAAKIRGRRQWMVTQTFCDSLLARMPPLVQFTLLLLCPAQPGHTTSADQLALRLQELYPGRAHVRFAELRLKRTDFARIPVPRWRRQRLKLPSRPFDQDLSAFFALPAALVQLVFRNLSLVEKLILARCNRWLLTMANSSSVFAFASASLAVSPTRLLMLPLSQNFFGLLRFISIRVVFSPDQTLWIVRKLLTLLTAQPDLQIAEFDARMARHAVWSFRSKRTRELYRRFLAPLWTLKAIFLPGVTDDRLFEELSKLPRLETLQVDLAFLRTAVHSSELTESFARFECLVTLHLVFPTTWEKLLVLVPLVASLRSLILQPTMESIPTAAVLIQLLRACPALHITLLSKPRAGNDSYNEMQRDAIMHALLTAVLSDIPWRKHSRLRLCAAGLLG